MKTTYSVALALLVASCDPFASGSTHPFPERRGKAKYPFSELVVFGDQLSDNGNGSYAHGLDPGNIYGYHTWTDGPVSTSYLNELLGVSLKNFAWGGSFGGGLAGSTVDNSYTPAKDIYNGKPVPSTAQQVDNYTSTASSASIKHALPLIWIGNNDVKKHTNWYADPEGINPKADINQAFYKTFTSLLQKQVKQLVDAGAPAVVVMNIYPVHASPANTYFFCLTNSQCTKNWGKVIAGANDYLEAALNKSTYANKIIYYDVFGFMTQMMANQDRYGFTAPLSNFCDGNHSLPECKWPICTQNKWSSARPYFWFTNGAMETNAHRYIAQDVKKAIDAHFK